MRFYPYDRDTERAVLYYLTEHPADLQASGLEAIDFHEEVDRKWWNILWGRYQDGEPIPGILPLVDLLKSREDHDELTKAVRGVDVTDWEFWAMTDRGRFLNRCQRLRQLTYQRHLADAGNQMVEHADDVERCEEVWFASQDELAALQQRIGIREPVSLVELYRQEQERGRVETTWRRIDGRVKGGVPRGGLLFAIARPGVGKTTWATNLIRRVADSKPDEHVVFVTLEQPAGTIVEKLMMAYLQLTDEGLATAVNDPEAAKWPAGLALDDFETATGNLHVWDDVRSVEAIHRRVGALDGQVAMVCIDYIQQMQHEKARDEYQLVTNICRELRPLAVDTKSAVVALSQLSRSGKKDRCPKLEDARGSGAIEEVGDIVLGLWRPDWDEEQAQERRVCDLRATILKQKWGYLGTVPFRFDLWLQRMTEVRWGDSVKEEDDADEGVLF